MAYNGLTNAGAAYLATRQANKLPVEFLKAKVGNGIVPSGTDPAKLTDIISGKMEVEITDIHQVERALKMTVQISNESLTTGFYLTEIAIFVNDNGTPVLYWYIGKDNGTYVPDSTKPMKYKNILNIEVSSTPVTTVNYTGKDLWIDEETLNIGLNKKVDKNTYTENMASIKADIDSKLPKGTYAGDAEELNQYIGSTYTKMMYILGQHDGDFPLSTARKDTVWFLPSNNRHYICTKDYNGPQISVPNSNFEDLSVYTNRLKINNLQNTSVETASESFFYESGDGWSAIITLRRYTKNGITTKETITIRKPAENGTINAKLYNITIPSSATFPSKYWGPPIGVGTDDSSLGYLTSSVVYNPSIIAIEFAKPILGGSIFEITYTWLYNV